MENETALLEVERQAIAIRSAFEKSRAHLTWVRAEMNATLGVPNTLCDPSRVDALYMRIRPDGTI
jgi:hypothetical protein